MMDVLNERDKYWEVSWLQIVASISLHSCKRLSMLLWSDTQPLLCLWTTLTKTCFSWRVWTWVRVWERFSQTDFSYTFFTGKTQPKLALELEEKLNFLRVTLYFKQKPGNSRPESSVDLRGAQLHWANELSSKKNVFKVRNQGTSHWKAKSHD